MYKLYAQSKKKGWINKDDKIGCFVSDDLDDLELLAEKFSPEEYYEYMIIEHTKDGDRIARRQELYQECTVEYSDDVKTSFEVKATTFKPSKMKQKEQLRKEIENYYKRKDYER